MDLPPPTMEEFLEMPRHLVLKYYESEGRKDIFEKLKREIRHKYKGKDGRPDLMAGFRAAQKLMPLLTLADTDSSPAEPEPEPEPDPEPEPEPEPEGSISNLTDDDLNKLIAETGSTNFIEDFQWCYDNIGRKGLKVEDAPSSAAHGMWDRYKNNNAAESFQKTAERIHILQLKTSENTDKAMKDDKRKQFALIDALLKPKECPHCGEGI